MKSIKYFVALALTLLCIASCKKNSAENETAERIEKVRVAPLTKTNFAREISFSATLQGYETQNVAPSVTGRIQHIFVEEGDVVTKGKSLVTMDELQFKTAKLQYTNLAVELARIEALLKTGAATQQQYDQMKLSCDQTKENLDFLEMNTYVKAPFDGVIATKNYEDGELYAGQPILVLTQLSQLKANVAIPERYFPLVKAGAQIEIRSDIYPDRTFKGVIERIFPTIDPASHNFTVKVKIANPDRALRPGMYVHTFLSLGDSEGIVVPYQSVLKLQGANDRYIFINDNGTARRVAVELGQRFEDQVELISDEIHEGDELIVTGQARLVNGSKLEIVND